MLTIYIVRPKLTTADSSLVYTVGMSSTGMACPTRKFLLGTVLDAIEKSAIAKQEYDSTRKR
jgi:hypothetical protein